MIALSGTTSCGHAPSSPSREPSAEVSRITPASQSVEVSRTADRPAVATVVRDGDPASAVVAVVLTGGSAYASTAMAAVLEARLRAAGVSDVDARA
ncbi:MAG TPA: hypothetical protein VGL13_07785, partial [Polyangiaceae bacterium]